MHVITETIEGGKGGWISAVFLKDMNIKRKLVAFFNKGWY